MILLRIENHGHRIERSSIWLGRTRVWILDELKENSIREITLDVGDYVGNNILSLRDANGEEISKPIPFFIEPNGLSSEEFKKIRHERIPSLLKKFGAENVHDVVYGGGYATYQIDVEDYAIDDLLNHYSKELIELTKKITECLTYASQKEVRKYKSEIKGKIKWQKTVRMRFQKGLSHTTSHVCERRKRTFITPSNLLLLKFHLEVLTEGATMLSRIQQRETEKMRWRGIYKLDSSREYDKKVLDTLSDLRSVLRVHRYFLTKDKFREALPRLRFIPRDNPSLIREAEFEAVRAKNRSYKPLVTLYKDFINNFHPTFMKTVPIDTQRTRDFYRVWAMCELVNALDLRSIGHTMREFKNRHETVFLYFQNIESLRHPWSEISDESALYMGGDMKAEDLSFIGPEIYLRYEGIDVFVDTIYGDFKGGLPREKIYEALGYMYDFEFKVGIVLYPGLRFHIKTDLRVPSAYKILIEAPLRPETIKTKKQLEKRKDYLRYLVWAAVILHRVARKKEDMARAIKSITRTIEVKYSIKT
ncbi:MAG: hypothetical protein JSW00_15605 [Thermoplasmata archaeon]|nr:MAG: hypothetical protein JSW00_15605 [Thermoplasmata archaeon]